MLIFGKRNPRFVQCITDHQDKVTTCLNQFEEFIDECFSGADKNVLASLKTAIDNSEASADGELRHAVDLMTNDFLPATRSSLISIMQSTDGIANICQEIVRRMLYEEIHLPECLHDDLREIISITKDQLRILYIAVNMLFGDYKKIFQDRKILDDVRTEESKVDRIEAIVHSRIFSLDISLCEKIYYRDLIERVCDLSDSIENIADKIQIMLVERES